MTYTILGYSPDEDSFGIAIATYSLAVGGYCPQVISHRGVLSSQANVDPRLGLLGRRLLQLGYSADKVLSELHETDEHFSYRQVGIIDRAGQTAVHTGPNTLAWHGHVTGQHYIAMGNGLAGEPTVTAMAEGFEAAAGESLESRLLSAIVAGRDAGGQRNSMPARSAALIVHAREEYALMDLRVDHSDEAIGQLLETYHAYRPYVPLYYELRVKQPQVTPPQEIWIKEQHPEHVNAARPGSVAGEG